MEFPGSEGRSGPASESGFALAVRMPALTPEVSQPEVVSRPEATTIVLRSYTGEGRSSAMLSEVNVQSQVVVTAEIRYSNRISLDIWLTVLPLDRIRR